MIHRPTGPWRLRTSCASNTGAPHALPGCAEGGECAARTIHLVSAVEGKGSAATRNNRPVTPEVCAASVSLRLRTSAGSRRELAEPARRQRARFNFGEILPPPQQRPPPARPPRKARDKTRSRRTL